MDPFLLDIPDQILTDRLLIRPARAGDGQAINDAIRESLADLQPWMPWAKTCPTVEETELHSRKSYASFISRRDDLPLRMFLRDTGEFVGGTGLHRINWEVPRGEIGYWVRTSQQHKGLMTEAVRSIAEFAFKLGMRRIEIRCDPRNIRSAAVAERAGFQFEGTLRCDSLAPDGTVRDSRVYSRIALS
jgi:ribosomal-protein-serine acetyltransferase